MSTWEWFNEMRVSRQNLKNRDNKNVVNFTDILKSLVKDIIKNKPTPE